MARTNTATEPTFQVFANRLNEHAAYVDNRFPAAFSPTDSTLSPEQHPEIYADWARRHNDLKAVAEAMAVANLEKAGLVIDRNDEKIKTLLAWMGENLLPNLNPPPRNKPATLAWLGDVDYKFDREIVVETIIGTLVALGDGSPKATAFILNYGIPNGLEGTTDSEVRGAEKSFARKMTRIMFQSRCPTEHAGNFLENVMWLLGVKARAAGMLWREMGGTTNKRGDRPHDELTSAMCDGSIFERHTQMLNRASEWELPPERLRDGCTWAKRSLLTPRRRATAKSCTETASRNTAPTIAT